MNEELSLTIETSGMTGSVAIGIGEKLVDCQFLSAPLKHSSETLPLINELFKKHKLKPCELKIVYVSAGPGSFTGIRIAATMAKTLAFAVEAKIVAVPSLDVLAINAIKAIEDGIEISNIGVILEAGRGNIFDACYSVDPESYKPETANTSLTPYMSTIHSPTMETPYEFLSKTPRPLHILGQGINYHKSELESCSVTILDETYYAPSAENAFECGKLRRDAGLYEDISNFIPIYMRKPEAELKWKELDK